MLSVREGGGAAPFCNCRFTRQDPTAYSSSEVRCLRDKCIKLASRSCLGKRTVSRNHAILARGFKGNKQFAKKGTVPFKKHKRQPVQTLEAPPLPCKSLILLCGNARDSSVGRSKHAWSKCMAESSFPFKTSGMSWGLASAKLHVSQISVVDRNLFIQAFW